MFPGHGIHPVNLWPLEGGKQKSARNRPSLLVEFTSEPADSKSHQFITNFGGITEEEEVAIQERI